MLTMDSTPPLTWGKITGTVTGAENGGTTVPLRGATVQVIGCADSYTLTTDPSGRYGMWLDQSESPVTVIVTLGHWQSQECTVNVEKRKTVTADFTLLPL